MPSRVPASSPGPPRQGGDRDSLWPIFQAVDKDGTYLTFIFDLLGGRESSVQIYIVVKVEFVLILYAHLQATGT